MQIVSTPPATSHGSPIFRFVWQAGYGWLALLFIKRAMSRQFQVRQQHWICDILGSPKMRRYSPFIIYRYMDLQSIQGIQTHNTHLYYTTQPSQTLFQSSTHSPAALRTPPQPKHRHTSHTSSFPTGLVSNYVLLTTLNPSLLQTCIFSWRQHIHAQQLTRTYNTAYSTSQIYHTQSSSET